MDRLLEKEREYQDKLNAIIELNKREAASLAGGDFDNEDGIKIRPK